MLVTLSDINRMYHDYFRTTGREPTRVYLGHEDYREIRQSGEVYIYGSFLEDRSYTAKIMGMLVFEVDEPRHLFVC